MIRSHRRILISALSLSLASPLVLAADAPKAGEKPATQPASEKAEVKKISLAEFEALRGRKNVTVLDVRTPKEFAEGHVPGAVNIPWPSRDFNGRVGSLDKSKTYAVHCLGGVRSAAAVKRMASLDFDHLFDFSGGWAEYSKAGKPVEK